MSEAEHVFRTYRLIRLLHNLQVITDQELIRHEEFIWDLKPVGIDIDWYNYRIIAGPNDIVQF